jgi:hypothetical protein
VFQNSENQFQILSLTFDYVKNSIDETYKHKYYYGKML